MTGDGYDVRRNSFAALAAAGFLIAAVFKAEAAPDNTLGMATMAAYVSAAGTLLQGSGVTGSKLEGSGTYRVDFDRNVTECFPSVTLQSDWLRALAQTSVSNTNSVRVWLVNLNTSAAAGSFYLTVFCSK